MILSKVAVSGKVCPDIYLKVYNQIAGIWQCHSARLSILATLALGILSLFGLPGLIGLA